MMDKIEAPFTEEQVENIRAFQDSKGVHPFTCCSPEDISECKRAKKESEGVLIAHPWGLECPCGKYVQSWVHSFMAEPL